MQTDPDRQRLTFGEVIEDIKFGRAFARAGWNGKGMFIRLTPGSVAPENDQPYRINGISRAMFELGDENTVTRMPCITLRAADGSDVTGWLASQTDMLAEDWTEVWFDDNETETN